MFRYNVSCEHISSFCRKAGKINIEEKKPPQNNNPTTNKIV